MNNRLGARDKYKSEDYVSLQPSQNKPGSTSNAIVCILRSSCGVPSYDADGFLIFAVRSTYVLLRIGRTRLRAVRSAMTEIKALERCQYWHHLERRMTWPEVLCVKMNDVECSRKSTIDHCALRSIWMTQYVLYKIERDKCHQC